MIDTRMATISPTAIAFSAATLITPASRSRERSGSATAATAPVTKRAASVSRANSVSFLIMHVNGAGAAPNGISRRVGEPVPVHDVAEVPEIAEAPSAFFAVPRASIGSSLSVSPTAPGRSAVATESHAAVRHMPQTATCHFVLGPNVATSSAASYR